jgi:hypothetical protein
MKTSLPFLLAFSFFLSAATRGADEEAVLKARRGLQKAIASRSNDQVKACLEVLMRAGGAENMEAVLKLLPKISESEDAIYWDLVQGACSFVDRPALERLGEAIVKLRGTPQSRDLIFGLAKNRSPRAVQALAPVLEKGALDLQVMAAEKIGTIMVPEAVDALLAALKREEKKTESELREVVVEGLQAITGQDFRINSVNWEGWWQKNRDKPLLGPRSTKDRGTGTAVDKLDTQRQKSFQGLERSPKKAVIVLSAEFPDRDVNNDQMANVLDSMRIPHLVVKRPDFEKFDLRGVGAILINCAQFHEFCICPDCHPGGTKQNRLLQCQGCNKHIKFSAKLSGAAIKKLQDFVARGGYLFCEDWIVKEVLERAFPQYVSTGAVLKKDTVDVVPARGRASHPYLKGIFSPEKPVAKEKDKDDDDPLGLGEPAGGSGAAGGGKDGKDGKDGKEGAKEGEPKGGEPKGGTVAKKPEPEPAPTPGEPAPEMVKVRHTWVIDDESWAFKIADPAKVSILLTSTKLQGSTGGEGVVAFCFRPGGDGSPTSDQTGRRRGPGMVLQVLSHFGKQESAEDEYTLQNLLLNFLLAAHVARNQDELPSKGRFSKKAGKKKAEESGKEEGGKAEGGETEGGEAGGGKDAGGEAGNGVERERPAQLAPRPPR